MPRPPAWVSAAAMSVTARTAVERMRLASLEWGRGSEEFGIQFGHERAGVSVINRSQELRKLTNPTKIFSGDRVIESATRGQLIVIHATDEADREVAAFTPFLFPLPSRSPII